MPENTQTQEDNTQVFTDDLSSSQSSEILPTTDSSSLSREDMIYFTNTLLEQMNVQQEQTEERLQALEDELHFLNTTVSENSVQSALVVVNEQERDSVSNNTVEQIKDILTDFYVYSVSANTVSENEIMQKPIKDYSTSESLSFILCVLVLCILLFNIFIERK